MGSWRRSNKISMKCGRRLGRSPLPVFYNIFCTLGAFRLRETQLSKPGPKVGHFSGRCRKGSNYLREMQLSKHDPKVGHFFWPTLGLGSENRLISYAKSTLQTRPQSRQFLLPVSRKNANFGIGVGLLLSHPGRNVDPTLQNIPRGRFCVFFQITPKRAHSQSYRNPEQNPPLKTPNGGTG